MKQLETNYIDIVQYVNCVADLTDSLVKDIDTGRQLSANTVKRLLKLQQVARQVESSLQPIKEDGYKLN